MSTALDAPAVLGCIALYVGIAGAVYAVARRFEALYCAEPAIAALWPIAVPFALIVAGCYYAGGWIAGLGGRGVEAYTRALQPRPGAPAPEDTAAVSGRGDRG